jgi:carboxymethylenebutenolidase
MSKISSTYQTLSVLDGTSMRAYVAYPKDQPAHRGMIVLQEAYGVNPHIRDITDRLAKEGFLAVAPELFHRTVVGFEGVYNDFESTKPHVLALTDEGLESDLRIAYGWLQSEGKIKPSEISAMGFCLGGKAAFIANSILPLKSSICFYGGGIADHLDKIPTLYGPMLFFWGALDKHIDVEHRRSVVNAMHANQKIFVHVVFSDAEHGFFNDVRPSYNQRDAYLAWAMAMEFLK